MKRMPSRQAGTEKPNKSSDRAVSRAAFKVMLGGVFSLAAGLVTQVVIARLFGASAEMDAYLTALVIPLYLESVLLAGLPFVLIPAFVREETTGGEEEAWSLAGTIFWLTTICWSSRPI